MPLSTTRRPQLIITADDFGRDEFCTARIADALKAGAINATSIMANARCFEQACALGRTPGLEGRIGVHLVLDEGPALSPEMAPFVDSRSELNVRRGLRRLGRGLAAAIAAELSAQIERVIAAGIRPTHLDSHRHIHTSFPIGRIVVRLARRYGIPYVRPARNLAARRSLSSGLYKWMFNRYLSSRVRTADHFGDVVDFFRRRQEHGVTGVIECMAHLDDSPRGHENLRLLGDEEFLEFRRRFLFTGHAHTSQ